MFFCEGRFTVSTTSDKCFFNNKTKTCNYINESIPSINSSLMKSTRNFDSMNFCVSFIDNGIIRSDMNKEWVPGIKLQHFLILTKTNEKSYIFNCIGSKKNAYSIFCPIV